MSDVMKYFKGSFVFMAVVLAALFAATGSYAALLSALTLTIVEMAVSFDNAVVNATYMGRMSPFWRKMFLTVGMLIAVGFMRLYFPIQIVSTIANIPLAEAWTMATTTPQKFADIVAQSHYAIAGFGGAFLMLVFLKFFIDADKEHHWIHVLESPLASLGKQDEIHVFIVGVASYVLSTFLGEHGTQFFMASLAGVGTHIAVDIIKEGLARIDEHMAKGADVAMKGGLGTFLYLEILDASFSLDGVIAAFAITNNILVVAAGLGIGAMFVRSMTIMLVEKGTLSQYRYMESGAFWAIGGLAISMYAGTLVHIPEWVIAVASAATIVIAVVHSIIENKKEAAGSEPVGEVQNGHA